MRKLLLTASFFSLVAAGCGSSTTSSGTPPPTSFCAQFQVGAGIICDDTTTPPTLKVKLGSSAGTVAAGDDPRLAAIDPDKGKYVGSFTPTIAQTGTHTSPGGLASGHGGGIIYNAVSGKVGVTAADEICASLKWPDDATGATVATAHMCNDDELVLNTRKGNIPVGTQGWSIGSATFGGNTQVAGGSGSYTDATTSNLRSHCGLMTYDSQDLYVGTHYTVLNIDPKQVTGVASNKAVAIKFVLDTSAPSCATVLPIACCR